MTDFYGTARSDIIREQTIAVQFDGAISALAGDDVIYAKLKSVLPGSGNDLVVAYSKNVNVIYWDAPSAVQINLRTGTASDGYGSTDQLQNVRTVTGTRFDDVFVASDAGCIYYPLSGSDVVTGGAGYDKVILYIDAVSDFIDIAKSKSNSSLYTLTYKSNGQTYNLSLSFVEQVKIFAAGLAYKTFSLSAGIEELSAQPQKYFVIPDDQYLGNYRFDRTDNLHIKATNLLTSTISDLSSDYAGIKYKDQTFAFNEASVPSDKIPWFHTVFTDPHTHNQYLLLSTLSTSVAGGEALLNTASSSAVVYGVNDGNVIDATQSFFSSIPQTYWTRDIHVGDINGDGLNDVFFSNQGREVGAFQDAPSPRINPVWGERNQLFLGSKSGWTAASSKLPNSVDFSHGSSMADIDGDGAKEIIVNNLGNFDGLPNRYILKWVNGALQQSFLPALANVNSSFSLAGDINHDGCDDVVVGSVVFWGGKDFGNQTSLLPFTPNQRAGFTNWHGGELADFNGDGYLDILKISASDGSPSTGLGAWQGLKLDLFLYSPQGWIDASDNFSKYDMDQFGINMALVDLDFDGHLDILTSGGRYFYGQNQGGANQFFFRNDGTGHFQLMTLNMANPQSNTYFLQNANGTINVISIEDTGYVYTQAEQLTPSDIHRFVGDYGAGQTQVPGFDAQYYNNAYPEVNVLISQGAYASALDHYLKKGQSQGANGFAKGTTVWGTASQDTVVLREGNETAQLGAGNDSVEGRAGDDKLLGGEGIDTAIWRSNVKQYQWTATPTGWTVRSLLTDEGIDTLEGIERLQFSDERVALDLQTNAGTVAKTIGAVFGKSAIGNKVYVGIGLYFVDELHYTYADLMLLAINAKLGATPISNQVVDLLYTNVVGHAPDAVTRNSFAELIDNHTFTTASLGIMAAETDFNKININLVGLAQSGLSYVAFGA